MTLSPIQEALPRSSLKVRQNPIYTLQMDTARSLHKLTQDTNHIGDVRASHGEEDQFPHKSAVEACILEKYSSDVSFLCVVKTQRRRSNKIYKTELTKTRYNNQVLGKYRVDPQRAGLTLIAELTWSNLGLKGVLNKRK